ncbi:MAG: ABC transporter ATP-binding protein [Alphaproteobacteria bacterium]|nr:ABC transporter ATP-binding protein [Alphaproteobacteria bacterium]
MTTGATSRGSVVAPGVPYVDAANVDKIYPSPKGAVTALRGVTFDIRDREFLSVLGPSGCGKSTFLKCVAGLTDISAGKLTVKGIPVAGPPANMGIVFQRDILLDWRTNLENVLLPVDFRRLSRKEWVGRARDLFALLGLSGFEDRSPWELSGGMRQRVAICRALIQNPELLLMDEPFGALDALTRDEMNLELQRVWIADAKTVLFITHSIVESVFLSDRVVVMTRSPGRVLDVIEIDLPRPRELNIRETPQFGTYVAHIRELFRQMGMFARSP